MRGKQPAEKTYPPLPEQPLLALFRLARVVGGVPLRPRDCAKAVLRPCPRDRGRCSNPTDFASLERVEELPEAFCVSAYNPLDRKPQCYDARSLAKSFNESPLGPDNPYEPGRWRGVPGCRGHAGETDVSDSMGGSSDNGMSSSDDSSDEDARNAATERELRARDSENDSDDSPDEDARNAATEREIQDLLAALRRRRRARRHV